MRIHARSYEPVAEVRTRLHALWLLRRGEGPTAVVGVGRNAVQRWLRWYREGGLDAVRDWLAAEFGVVSWAACTRCYRGWGSG